ncbi:MAG: HDOD domain-containing protein, partial [Syntrophales bacterium LBB04]|nr:HDOD domain-containing protein [Syntrophales bacterium LBB04]
MNQTEESILREVEEELESMHLGFTLSPEDQAILDQPHLASKDRILKLEENLSVPVKNELFRIANSPLYARHQTQKAEDFWEVSQMLGMENIKAFIFSSALFGITYSNNDILTLKDRCLATAGFSLAIMHNVLGFDLNIAPKVQLCALVSEFGKIPFFITKQKKALHQSVQEIMTEDFINIHHGQFGIKMIKKFDLPDFLFHLFDKNSLIFFDQEHDFSITTVVRIAKLLVRDSFKRTGKLVITSVVDDQSNVIHGSVGSELQTFFDTLGIGHLLEIIPFELPAQEYARKKKK